MYNVSMERKTVSSSSIRSIGYEVPSSTLEVEFDSGDVYQYFSVPQRVYLNLVSASSHEEFLSNYIRHSYRYQRVG